jgi:hypothetical protein
MFFKGDNLKELCVNIYNNENILAKGGALVRGILFGLCSNKRRY